MVTGYEDREEFKKLSPPAQSFLSSCLKWDIAARPDARDLYLHPFVISHAPLDEWSKLSPARLLGEEAEEGASGYGLETTRRSSLRVATASTNSCSFGQPCRVRLEAKMVTTHHGTRGSEVRGRGREGEGEGE